MRKKSDSAELDEEQVADPNAGESSEEVDPDDESKGSPMNPVPGWSWRYDLETRSFYPIRYSPETGLEIDPDRYKPTISPLL